MRRTNVQEARAAGWIGDDLPVQPEDQALLLEVHGGQIVLIVPPNADETSVTAQARVIRGTINLENERVLSFEVRAGAIGSSFHDEAVRLAERGGATGPLSGAGGETTSRAERAGGGATAADIMTREVITTGPLTPVRELAKRLSYHRISGMPVVDDSGVVVGVVSEADLISKQGRSVRDIMARDVIGVSEDTPALEVAALLTRERIKRVPVLRDGRLVGLIGRSNVVSWVAGEIGNG